MGAGDGRQETPGLARLAVKAVGQQHRLVAQRPAGVGRGGAQLPHAAGDVRLHIVQALGRLPQKAGPRRFAQGQAVFFGHGQCAGAGGRVGAGRAGGDHIERVAQNVRQNDLEHPRRGAVLRKPPALDGGKALAHRVDLDNIRPAPQQLAGDALQLRAGHQRLFKQRAAPAREQKHDGIPGVQILGQRQRGAGGGKGVFVRQRVPGFIAGHAGQRALRVAVFGDDGPAVHAGQHLQRGAGHLPGGLAGRHQQHAAGPRRKRCQRAAHRFVRQHGGNGLPHDALHPGAQFPIHTITPFIAVAQENKAAFAPYLTKRCTAKPRRRRRRP